MNAVVLRILTRHLPYVTKNKRKTMKKIDKLQNRILNKIDKLLDKKNKHWEIQHLSQAYKDLESSK